MISGKYKSRINGEGGCKMVSKNLYNNFKSSELFVILFTVMLLFTMNNSVLYCGTPHVAYGTVHDSEGIIPADADFSFNAYITIRPGEVLTKASLGCGYNEGTGTWTVECGNFPTAWQIGDILRIDFTDIGAGSGGNRTETGSDQGQLTEAGSDNFEDTSLPVQMNSITATLSQENGVTLIWRTESETDCAGFHVWRSESEEGEYVRMTTALIPGSGNTSNTTEYAFNDKNVQGMSICWYKIEEISIDGKSTLFGPVSVEATHSLPTEYGLSQNYPNPFNPETTFQYQLPEISDVTIEIYSILGQKIKTWQYANQPSGYYTVNWNGIDDLGRRVSSGIYLMQMTAGSYSEMRKMTIMH